MRRWISVFPLLFFLLCGAPQVRADSCNGFTDNLVSNCGFELGSFARWAGTATTIGVNYAGIDTGDPFTAFPTPYNGRFEAYLGYPGATVVLTQNLATIAGSSYLVEFALLNDTSPSPGYTNSLLATFGSGAYSLTGISAGAYTLYSFGGTASSSSTALSFTSRNDGGYFELDSVSAIQTPEPSSWMLLATGVLGAWGIARRQLAS